jgi:hypothetical protein
LTARQIRGRTTTLRYLVFNPFRKASIDGEFRKPHWWNKLDVRWQILGVCQVIGRRVNDEKDAAEWT